MFLDFHIRMNYGFTYKYKKSPAVICQVPKSKELEIVSQPIPKKTILKKPSKILNHLLENIEGFRMFYPLVIHLPSWRVDLIVA